MLERAKPSDCPRFRKDWTRRDKSIRGCVTRPLQDKHFPSPPPPPPNMFYQEIKGCSIQVPQRKKSMQDPITRSLYFPCTHVTVFLVTMDSLFLERFWREFRIFCQVPQTSQNLQNWRWYFDLLMTFSSPCSGLILQCGEPLFVNLKKTGPWKRLDVGLVWELHAVCYGLLVCAYSKEQLVLLINILESSLQ